MPGAQWPKPERSTWHGSAAGHTIRLDPVLITFQATVRRPKVNALKVPVRTFKWLDYVSHAASVVEGCIMGKGKPES